MSNDPSARRLMPQTSQMGAFAFQPGYPPSQQQRETQKNYVFVDEHNRHKRLKVMRACEGCRRRKIKCDAATTNTWPCSACIRLKLICVRPNGYEGSANDGFDPGPGGYDVSPLQDEFQPHMAMQQQHMMGSTSPKGPPGPGMYAPNPAGYHDGSGMYQTVPYNDPNANLHYTTVPPPPPMGGMDSASYAQNVFPTPPMQASQGSSPPDSYSAEPYNQADLADLLGSLKMNEVGTAPYLNSKLLAKGGQLDPVVGDEDDYKSSLPPLVSGPGLKIRIPPELMPDDETVTHYFELYFAHVHPFVPVLDKSQFYRDWQSNRESVSPLLLEAIFAISGRLADEPAQGQQWLALATKHADSFMDVPRLSTLQALLIVLKAREAAPKRGYYYRSWMAIVQCVQMGKDLGLDEHYADHQAGRECDGDPIDCLVKTRIWQTIFICEVMIGSPQGRLDLSVEEDTVDTTVPRMITGIDESEYTVSRQFSFFARVVGNVSRMTRVYARLKKKNKDWGADPEFVQLNPSFHTWLNDLPPDLSISFPPNGSAPWLPSSFIGNLHSYYYLSIILLHRPQLHILDPTRADGQWKQHMMICYSSAKLLCRLEEGILQNFGLTGLQSMQRGVNFTIYAVLTCVVLHLVALTSPDPDLYTDAREYFTRHMRILEQCTTAWPMPDMQKQIDAVREAFSQDVRKPFVLKPSFPYGSPQTSHSSPPRSAGGYRPSLPREGSMGQQINTSHSGHPHVGYGSHPISPPISAGPLDIKNDPSPAQSLASLESQVPHTTALQGTMPMSEAPGWNPSRIFDQWNTTFGATEVPTLQDIQTVHASLPSGIHPAVSNQYPPAPIQTFVTPTMWQESVASVYEGGLKRSWDYDSNPMSMTKRRA